MNRHTYVPGQGKPAAAPGRGRSQLAHPDPGLLVHAHEDGLEVAARTEADELAAIPKPRATN